jgi:hypothetical protein
MRRRRRPRLSIEQLEARDVPSITGLQTLYRSGQTFVTWQEDTAASGAEYNVYWSAQPITAANLQQTTLLTGRWGPLPPGTSIDTNERARGSDAVQQNYVLSDLGPQLSDTTGLFVNTVHADGPGYYAVTEVVNGVEDRTVTPGQNATTTAVNEAVATPRPILVSKSADGRGLVYEQFEDYSQWNPTFDGYTYNYSVALPPGYDGTKAVPLMIYLNGYGDRYRVHDGTPYDWNSIWVEPDDPKQSWYFGFDASYDYRQGGVPASGTIVNFTEERILQTIDQVSSLYNVDPNRVWGHGMSMGGSGLLALAMRYPDVFSAVYAGLPMTDYATSADQGGSNWLDTLVPKWGTVASNLPIASRGPHAAALQKYDGTGVWDWQNHLEQLVNRAGDPMAYITGVHTMQDTVINWPTQGAPFVGALEQGHAGFVFANVPGTHNWPGFVGSDAAMIGPAWDGWSDFQFVKDMSFPALANVSNAPAADPPASTTASYFYNRDVGWSTPWNHFGQDVVDQPARYEITLRSTDADLTADVTPRRLQQFVATPGAVYSWENQQASDGTVTASGTVTADAHGLITVPGFSITPGGNRLILVPAGGTSPAPTPTPAPTPAPSAPSPGAGAFPSTSNGTYLFADQLPDTYSSALVQFVATHFVGTQKMVLGQTDRYRAVNPGWVELHYQLATASGPVSYITNDQWGSDWASVTANEDWFLHDPTGQRLHNSAWNWYQNDVSNPAWRQYWLSSVIANMRAEGSQGVFADSFTAGIGSFWYD